MIFATASDRATADEFRRFFSYIQEAAIGCWVWTAGRNTDGYGRFYSKKYGQYAHRFAYSAWVGDIPEGYTIDHLCGVKLCCNPTHLEAVTARENTLRGMGRSAVNARKTHCIRGHAFDETNTYVDPRGTRKCRECTRLSHRRRYWQTKAAA